MKKIILLLTCLALLMPVYADVSSNTVGKDALIEYKFSTDPEKINSIKVGFSKNPVTALDTVVSDAEPSYELEVKDGEFSGTLKNTDTLHVYWQLLTTSDIVLSLEPKIMDGEDDPNNKLHVTVTTTNDKTQTGVNGTELTYDTSSVPESDVILSYVASKVENKQAAGSQTITITTENIQGKAVDTYKGTLTLKITNGGE